jgi:hypothetical protein
MIRTTEYRFRSRPFHKYRDRSSFIVLTSFLFVMAAHIMNIATGRTLLPKVRCLLVVVHGLHPLIAERADLSGSYQSAFTDTLVAVHIHVDQCDAVFVTFIHHSPEETVTAVLLVITGIGKIRLAGCQNGMVRGYGD